MDALLPMVAAENDREPNWAECASFPIAEQMAAARTKVMRTLILFRFIMLTVTPPTLVPSVIKKSKPSGWRRRRTKSF